MLPLEFSDEGVRKQALRRALLRQDLSCKYLAHHELESIVVLIITIVMTIITIFVTVITIFITVITIIIIMMQVYAPTFPGYGRSEKQSLAYSQELWRDFLRDFVLEVVQRPVIVAGNSIGGFISASLAADYPSLVKGGSCMSHRPTLNQ